ncbi:MAG: efflux RND transporter periplasmic adaptor subunit [bacterium]
MNVRRLSLLFAVVAIGWMNGCAWLKKNQEPNAPKIEGEKILLSEKAPQMAYLKTETAKPRPSSASNLYGRVVWDEAQTVQIFSPVAGRVKKILGEIGQVVSKGDVLAVLDSPDYGQAQSEGNRAKSDLLLSEKNLGREKALFQHGAAPRKDVEAAQADYQKALAESKRAAARLSLYGGKAGVVDDLFPLKTPLSGVVVDRKISPGQEVRPDQMLANAPQFIVPLFIVSNPKKLWVQLDVSEAYLPFMKPGQGLKIHSKTYPDKTFEGKLESVGHSLDPSTRTVKARGSLENPDELLKTEMYVTVDLEEEKHPSGVEIPSKALLVMGEKRYVFVEETKGRFFRQEVKVGHEYDGKVAILEGLKEGESVVTDGALLLEEMLESKEG